MSHGREKRVTLKDLAKQLNLSAATISRALSGSPQADALADDTRQRVEQAARKLNYRPNYLARSLRGKRSFSVGVLLPEISEGYAAGIMSGIEAHLEDKGYLYLMSSHHSQSSRLDKSLKLLQDRGVEGFIAIAADLETPPDLPTVVVSGRRRVPGVTHVVLNHDAAADLALSHLSELGHQRIAFFRGRSGNVDSDDRWRAIQESAQRLGLVIEDGLTLRLRGEAYGEAYGEAGYQEGYTFGTELLNRGLEFSALFAFNDISAIGAMRAFEDAGRRIPDHLSVVGFDDIQSAAFHRPSLTTVRQPLREMGERAAQVLVRRLAGDNTGPGVVTVEPELKLRQSTGPHTPSLG